MAPRTLNPRSHALRRDEFIDAGQHLIQTRGYEHFSVEDLLAEVSASKGAFYHYFGSKQALLEAIVERMAERGVVAVATVVDDPNLTAVEKLRSYFATIASIKAEQRDFLVALMRVWFSDDNAIVRQKLRRETVRLVTPQMATIVRQGIAEGEFSLADPDQMARVVLSLVLDVGDDAGEMYLARQAGQIDLGLVRQRLATYATALERVLGVSPGTLRLVDETTLHAWFGQGSPDPRKEQR